MRLVSEIPESGDLGPQWLCGDALSLRVLICGLGTGEAQQSAVWGPVTVCPWSPRPFRPAQGTEGKTSSSLGAREGHSVSLQTQPPCLEPLGSSGTFCSGVPPASPFLFPCSAFISPQQDPRRPPAWGTRRKASFQIAGTLSSPLSLLGSLPHAPLHSFIYLPGAPRGLAAPKPPHSDWRRAAQGLWAFDSPTLPAGKSQNSHRL